MCRQEFTHLPRVSELLHNVLKSKFPGRYRERARETVEFEAEQEIESMQTDETDEVKEDEVGRENTFADAEASCAASEEDEAFRCDNCGGRLFHPSVVSPCSHCLCGLCSGIYARPPKDEVPSCASPSAQPPLKQCPVCDCTLAAPPKVCHILNDYLVKKYGRAEDDLGLIRRPRTRSESGGAEPACGCCGGGAGDGEAEGGTLEGEGSGSGEARREGEGDINGEALLQDRIIRVLKSPCDTESQENFVHFGVGCDGCGVCPIVGRRYTCLECKERIGFDLCARCNESHVGPGRFNQQHRPEHKMELVEPKETLLHALLKNHPGYTAEYLIELLNGGE